MFELMEGEYADVSYLPFDRRKQLFPNIDNIWLTKRYMVAFRNSKYNDVDCYCDDSDLRITWIRQIINLWHCDKERKIYFVNNLGRM